MYCSKCGNKIEDGDNKCSKCGTEVVKKKWKKYFLIVLLLVLIISFCIIIKKHSDKDMNSKDDSEITTSINSGISLTSFSNLRADGESFNNTQKLIIDYFDNNYFYDVKIENLQKYPQIYKGAKISTNAEIIKVLKSTDEEFEVLAVQGGSLGARYDGTTEIVKTGYSFPDEIPENDLLILRGTQLNKRLVKGDVITLYGRYNNVENIEIDGKSYILPVINSINILQLGNDENENYRFGIDTIKNVAEYIFGKDIKISTPVLGEDYENKIDFALDPFYKVILDNQSNANFSAFNMYRNYGVISYNEVSLNTVKKLFIGADFQHYIVTTYDKNLKHVYIDYFDKEFKKIWNREFDYNSNEVSSPIDYTNKLLAIVIDNDLHLINLENGEDSVSPVLVGTKINVNIMPDGIILIGNDNKDTIMKIGYDGNIIYRTNGNTDMNYIFSAQTQIVNEKMVVCIEGDSDEGPSLPKYYVLNDDGTIEFTTSE